MIKVHVAADGTKSFQVYGRARIREKSVRVYIGSFASQKQAEAADEQHRVTQRAIKAGDLPAVVDRKRTLGYARSRTSARTTNTRSGCGSVLRAGVPKKLRLHDLRHTFAGLFLASGGDIFKLSKILGHSSVAITQQVYAHLHPDAFAEDYNRSPLRPATGRKPGFRSTIHA